MPGCTILNMCPVALRARRYNNRHDAVLQKITTTISNHLQPTERMTCDLSEYVFPQHIAPMTLRPDIVLWDDTKRRVLLIELTACFETSFDNAAERKRAKYTELQQSIWDAGYLATLITLEVGSRGIIHHPGFSRLKKELRIRDTDFKAMLQSISQETITQSYCIWCQRNHQP